MGFVWIVSLVVFSWAGFVLGRKYQDLQDVMMARRVKKLIEQRKQVHDNNDEWEEVGQAVQVNGPKRMKILARRTKPNDN